MKFRLAIMEDLIQVKEVYKEIVKNLYENSIKIWDDIYPSDYFEEDIVKQRLYLLMDKRKIVSAFVLSEENEAEECVEWESKDDKVLYLDRLGVNVDYSRQGIGSVMLTQAKKTSKKIGAKYLRLFVVDINKPAIDLYIKNGFSKVPGFYDEVTDDEVILHEFGYEVAL